MKSFLKILLQYYLKYITELALFIHRPVIIAVAGSTNKTFVRDDIKNILKKKGLSVRANPKSFNTEIGLPLAILNLESGYGEYGKWPKVMWQAVASIFQKNFPKFLVLELGVSRRGDMKYLLSIVKPKIAVITNITQRYLENFSGMDSLAGEYEYLAKKTQRDGIVIINCDNSRSQKMAQTSFAKVNFYGKSEKCQAKIKNIERQISGEIAQIEINGKIEGEKLLRFGEHHAYARAAARLVENYVIAKYPEVM